MRGVFFISAWTAIHRMSCVANATLSTCVSDFPKMRRCSLFLCFSVNSPSFFLVRYRAACIGRSAQQASHAPEDVVVVVWCMQGQSRNKETSHQPAGLSTRSQQHTDKQRMSLTCRSPEQSMMSVVRILLPITSNILLQYIWSRLVSFRLIRPWAVRPHQMYGPHLCTVLQHLMV